MARPNKQGLDYFPFDVDFFDDEKIEAISGEFGIKGEITAIKLLCAIYRNGYFILWSDMLKMKLLKNLPGVSSELLDAILNRLVLWDFFDKSLFDSMGVLTSKGIQKRFFSIVKRRNKNEDYPYLLVTACNNEVYVCNNSSETELLSTKSTQRKEKERKENNISPLSPIGDIPPGESASESENNISDNPLKTPKKEKEKSSAKKELNYSFDSFWELYDKKVGRKDLLIRKWLKLSDIERESAMSYIPRYKLAQPDKKYRKNPETFLNSKAWNDELISANQTNGNKTSPKRAPDYKQSDFD